MSKQPLIGKFWFAHGVLAVALQAIVAAPLALLGIAPWLAAAIGAAVVVVAYAARERVQAEAVTGRNTALWNWSGNPKAAKDIGVPAALTGAIVAAAAIMEAINGV